MKAAIFAAVLTLMFAPLRASADDTLADLELDPGRTVIDCSNSLVKPPAGLQVECGTYPRTSDPSGVDSGGDPACVNPRYDIRGLAGQPSLYVYARIRGTSSNGCGVWPPQNARNNMVTSTKKYKPFVHDDATNWSRKPIELKHAGVALLFDSPNKDRDGKCVAFFQPGPPLTTTGHRQYTRYYYMRGWVCTPPGQTLDKAAAIDLIKSFKIEVR
jgi:hypothetical protein